ncbi:DUF5684 domain-containing protein [Bacteroidota bacterium]
MLIVIYIALVVLYLVSMWKVFTKAGKPGWAILIPIYDIIVLLEIVGKPWWWLLLIMFVPVANVIFAIWMLNLLSLSFGKTAGFTLGLLFLSPIFIPILGLGKAEYKGPAGAAPAAA